MQSTGILRTVSGYLNGATAIGDAFPGTSVLGYAGQVPLYSGQLGAFEVLSFAGAQKLSDPAVAASLQGGRYQYVQFAADGTAYAQGQVLYWKDETNFIVTNVPPASLAFAGICIAPVTQGNYWFHQTDGVAQVLFGATVQATAGTATFSNYATPSVAVNVTDATAIVAGTTPISGTSAPLKGYLGTVKGVPTASVLNLVYLKGAMPQVN